MQNRCAPFWHAIRHYFAVSLVKSQKADITDIQQLLGHQRPTTTDIYLRSVAPNLDRLAGVIEGVVGDVAIHDKIIDAMKQNCKEKASPGPFIKPGEKH